MGFRTGRFVELVPLFISYAQRAVDRQGGGISNQNPDGAKLDRAYGATWPGRRDGGYVEGGRSEGKGKTGDAGEGTVVNYMWVREGGGRRPIREGYLPLKPHRHSL